MTNLRLFILPALFLVSAVPVRAQDQFPDGPGMDILRTKCRTCHMADRVTKVAGRDVEGWQTLVTSMMNRGATVTEDEVPILVEYLATNWPVDRKLPVMNFTPLAPMASHARAEFTEWDVPTPAAQPHDPLAAADGSLRYTGTKANGMGPPAPKNGAM